MEKHTLPKILGQRLEKLAEEFEALKRAVFQNSSADSFCFQYLQYRLTLENYSCRYIQTLSPNIDSYTAMRIYLFYIFDDGEYHEMGEELVIVMFMGLNHQNMTGILGEIGRLKIL